MRGRGLPLAGPRVLCCGVLALMMFPSESTIDVPLTAGNVTYRAGERDAAPPGEVLAAVRAAFRGEGERGVFEADFRLGAGDEE